MKNLAATSEAKKQRAIEYLGSKCNHCGSTEHLEFDHIDKDSKLFNLGTSWTRSWESILAEINKCQLLCKSCHIEKTLVERNLFSEHGKLSMYNNGKCRCEKCMIANRDYQRSYRKALA